MTDPNWTGKVTIILKIEAKNQEELHKKFEAITKHVLKLSGEATVDYLNTETWRRRND